ncbi:MAG TPA: 1-acyl-sn-glycerol-3-phosphate acyltransferase [Alphaproteobacteria bacterium]|jgi:1-acyl-sn-glycerol-3-phosphate acyltransferase|nr:1-acyl-sn-glycerol-3-phosphate acyltransferase [Alphaproteobacteria bacterium]
MSRLRSIAFSIAFPLWTGICCIALAFGPLLPRRGALQMALLWVRSVAWVERTVLGLHYRVIGTENLPAHGAFIVAAKHQSTFETMKLHLLLNDPAIVLKKELLKIPIWGPYLKSTGMIPIDRGAGRKAMGGMLEASEKAKAEGRPIVIFPQGTRIPVGVKRNYKSGVTALYQALEIPILPLALNSGLFWPKTGRKHGGTVTFSFLPPIEPGLEPESALSLLEQRLETETDRLVAAEKQEPAHS